MRNAMSVSKTLRVEGSCPAPLAHWQPRLAVCSEECCNRGPGCHCLAPHWQSVCVFAARRDVIGAVGLRELGSR